MLLLALLLWFCLALLIGMLVVFIVPARAVEGGPCPLRAPYSQHDIRRLIDCAADRFNADEATLVCIGSHESGLRPRASNGSYAGVFQYASSTWHNIALGRWHRDWGAQHVRIPSRLNGRAQVIVTAMFTRNGNYSPWEPYVSYDCPGF